jgi:hypothetical protein
MRWAGHAARIEVLVGNHLGDLERLGRVVVHWFNAAHEGASNRTLWCSVKREEYLHHLNEHFLKKPSAARGWFCTDKGWQIPNSFSVLCILRPVELHVVCPPQ